MHLCVCFVCCLELLKQLSSASVGLPSSAALQEAPGGPSGAPVAPDGSLLLQTKSISPSLLEERLADPKIKQRYMQHAAFMLQRGVAWGVPERASAAGTPEGAAAAAQRRRVCCGSSDLNALGLFARCYGFSCCTPPSPQDSLSNELLTQ